MTVKDIRNITKNSCLVAVDCGPLDKPDHGDIILLEGTKFGKRIKFKCNIGYKLRGSRRRTCQSDGTWSGYLTTCDSK